MVFIPWSQSTRLATEGALGPLSSFERQYTEQSADNQYNQFLDNLSKLQQKMKQRVFDYIKKKYKVSPDYPWIMYDDNAVFRHKDTRKWFALMMEVARDKLGLSGSDPVDVLNLKTDGPFFHGMIIQQPGIMPGYHMNKQHWISVLLDGTVSEEQIFDLIDMSFAVTSIRKGRKP